MDSACHGSSLLAAEDIVNYRVSNLIAKQRAEEAAKQAD